MRLVTRTGNLAASPLHLLFGNVNQGLDLSSRTLLVRTRGEPFQILVMIFKMMP